MLLEEYIDWELTNVSFSIDPSFPIVTEETKERTKQNATTDYKRNGIGLDWCSTDC